ncbi:DUF1254-domain-containing protein [Penicillium riverlandense]|uniref:DUF1254-domain-containing protein n=1 Tax=Penicillium riverlandense TaxID=1903569 RepID=UPI0025495760|nr:DUF1254-domain-containing protein [Penicillium riverlandense]KAJ5833814.1 DUF1254-domain-containing protein [Penicillium riverlandense]
MKLQQLLAATVCGVSTCASAGVDEATQFTLTYGYPLLPLVHFAVPILEEVKGTNRFKHMRELATSAFHDVVRPNVDTLYSTAVIDLSHHDVLVDVPVVEDRYWVFPFYDAYANNYANIGSVTNSTAGTYILRYNADHDHKPGVQLCGEKEKGSRVKCDRHIQGYVNAPTPYGIIVTRYAVKEGTPADLAQLHALQNQSHLHAVEKKIKQPTAPPLTISMLNSSLSSDPATKLMQLTARIAPHNPPRDISDRARVNRMLKEAGVHPDGSYQPPHGVNLTAAYTASQKEILTAVTLPQNHITINHGWNSLAPSAQGDYGTNYAMRAFVAYSGYLGLDASQALYPSYNAGTNSTTLHLAPKQAYIFTFASKPPLDKTGFWSLTAYDAEQYLVPNPLGRYALNKQGNITYADGSRVYGDASASSREDGSFQLLVQPADVTPPKNWTANWLPAPKGGGDLYLMLRFYAPTEGLRNGSWSYPVVQKGNAIEA